MASCAYIIYQTFSLTISWMRPHIDTVKCTAVSPASTLLNRRDSVSSDYHQPSSIITNQLDFRQDPPHGPASEAQKQNTVVIYKVL